MNGRARTRRAAICLAAWALVVLVVGCELVGTVETYHYVPGTYDATVFTMAGPADGQVDVLADGGSLVMTLNEDGSVEGDLSYSASPDDDTTFTARFSVYRDTLYLHETHVLVTRKLVWDKEAATLTAPPARGWAGLYELVLQKREE